METIIKHIEQLEKLVQQKKNIPTIERDLILEKLRSLYESVLVEKMIAAPPLVKTEIVETNPKEVVEPSSIEIDEKIQELETEQEEIATEELLPVKEEPKEIVEEPEKVVRPEAGIDLFSTEGPGTTVENKESIGDKISKEQKKETVADKFQNNKITSLKDAIGINEKFFFINELFSGELNVYNQSLEKLDQLATETESKQFLSGLTEKFGWDSESEAFLQLQDFVQKKFTP